MSSALPTHLEPSELGNKEYWDEFYSADLSTPPSPTTSLDGWFSDVNASSEILKWLQSPSLALEKKPNSFMDLGTGNGEMLFLLREKGGFEGPMLGVDYCTSSIELAKKVSTGKGIDDITFQEWNIMRDQVDENWLPGLDVVLDKGTFDAISLSEEKDDHGRRICEAYRERVDQLVKPGGLLVVTSCNCTKFDLLEWVAEPTSGEFTLKVWSEVSYPTFSFGGQVGQSISTLCFNKLMLP